MKLKMVRLTKLLRQFFADEKGQSITEYAGIIALVAVLGALVFNSSGCIRQVLYNSYYNAVTQLNNANVWSGS